MKKYAGLLANSQHLPNIKEQFLSLIANRMDILYPMRCHFSVHLYRIKELWHLVGDTVDMLQPLT